MLIKAVSAINIVLEHGKIQDALVKQCAQPISNSLIGFPAIGARLNLEREING